MRSVELHTNVVGTRARELSIISFLAASSSSKFVP